LFCDESSGDGSTTITNEYSILVEQPRVPIGVASIFELPAGMIDDENESVAGIAVKEMQEECGINIIPSDLIDLTELALEDVVQNGRLPIAALPPSGGGCDEFVRYMYLEKKVTTAQLDAMKGRLSGLHDHGEYITLSVVPMQDVWKVSGDSKAMM
jgi:ADP-sugar diphosphatase